MAKYTWRKEKLQATENNLAISETWFTKTKVLKILNTTYKSSSTRINACGIQRHKVWVRRQPAVACLPSVRNLKRGSICIEGRYAGL